jgi:hypothetical protein
LQCADEDIQPADLVAIFKNCENCHINARGRIKM